MLGSDSCYRRITFQDLANVVVVELASFVEERLQIRLICSSHNALISMASWCLFLVHLHLVAAKSATGWEAVCEISSLTEAPSYPPFLSSCLLPAP